MTKICNQCKVLLDLQFFYKDKRNSDGCRGICKTCHNVKSQKWFAKNPIKTRKYRKKCREQQIEKYRKKGREYWTLRPDYLKRQNKQRRENFKQKDSQKRKEYYKTNQEKLKNYSKDWRKENPSKVLAQTSKRRAARIEATPPWLSKEHLAEIEEMYILAKELSWLFEGEKLEVDHIIPLQGKYVRGLHVPWNLQLLSEKMNRKKYNNWKKEDCE